MKLPLNKFRLVVLSAITALGFSGAMNVRAGIDLQVDIIRNNAGGGFTCNPNLTLTTNGGDSTPITYDVVISPHTNFNGFLGTNGDIIRDNFDLNFAGFMNAVTNGTWKLIVNAGSQVEKTYTFTVSAPNLTSNTLPFVGVDFPSNGQTQLPPLPNFTWHGPNNWDSLFTYVYNSDFSLFQYTFPDPSATNGTVPPALTNGNYIFFINYSIYVTPLITTTTPHDASLNPLPGFNSTGRFDDGNQAVFSVFDTNAVPKDHTLIAHYTFDDSSDPGRDSSGNTNDLNCGSTWGADNSEVFDTNAIAGGGALKYFGQSSLVACSDQPAFTALTNVLAGTFSVSVWINTTNVVGNDTDGLFDYTGQSIVYGDNNDTGATVGIVGHKAAFRTTDPDGNEDTLRSSQNVTTGSYVHIVATRDMATGLKRLYINGLLDASDIGSTESLFGSGYDSLGGQLQSPYTGLLDDVQIYSGVLNFAEVAYLYQHPGMSAPDLSSNGLVAHYAFDLTGNQLGNDSSGHGYNLDYNGSTSGNGPTFSSDARAGGGAVFFDGGSFFAYSNTPAAVLSTLASDFTASVWLKTSQLLGDPEAPAYGGAGIVTADIPGLFNDISPIGLTGGKVAFTTGGNSDDTTHSTSSISDGTSYHHVVVTRNLATGEKQIYVDGAFQNSDFATTNLLNAPVSMIVGAFADADQTNPDNFTVSGEYSGLMDDLQIYSRVLNSNEIAFLYQNPGSVVGDTNIVLPPVSLTLSISVYREQGPDFGDVYYAFPSISVDTPNLITTNEISSPNNGISAHEDAGGGGGAGSSIFSSLDQMINECTNGLWTLYINQEDASQHIFHFSISISGLTTNVLVPVPIYTPTNGAVVPANPPFRWSGPVTYGSLNVYKQKSDGSDIVQASFPTTVTNWPSPPSLDLGTNVFHVEYVSNGFAGITFSIPVDYANVSVSNLVSSASLHSTAFTRFLVASAPQPVLLSSVLITNGNLRFSFTSTAGHTNHVQVTTNLASPNWAPFTNIIGDGTLKNIVVPANTPSQRFFRVLTQ